MAYLATQLINEAYYLSGVVARNQQTVTGQQSSDGLRLLNALLAIKTAVGRKVPYYSQYTTNAVIGQEAYLIPNLIDWETVTFNQQTIRYSMVEQSRKAYFGSARVDNIQSLPFNFHIERTKGGATLYLYFVPNSTYPLKITGKFSLTAIATLDTDLEDTLDDFYIEYLRYALADYICNQYNILFQPQSQAKLNEYEEIVTDVSPMDLTVTKYSSLQNGNGLNWAMINFPGWTP
jgi:hypothetical protein